jgi:uncharacterized membrane protein YeaQ/YmgE (transglycosylase-associated protein family)
MREPLRPGRREDAVLALGLLVSMLGYLVLGVVVGMIARVVVPGTGGMGIISTAFLGGVGAWAAGSIVNALGGDTFGIDWIASIVGAIVMVAIFGRRRGRARS